MPRLQARRGRLAAAAIVANWALSTHVVASAAAINQSSIVTPELVDITQDTVAEQAIGRIIEQARARRRRRRESRSGQYRPLPIHKVPWRLDDLHPNWIPELFRFTKEEIRLIVPFLHLDRVPWKKRYSKTPEEALCIVLFHLSWPHREKDTGRLFYCSAPRISSIFNDVCLYIWRRFQQPLLFDEHRLNLAKLREFAAVVEEAGGGHRIWGWIDGTLVKTCRPTRYQRVAYTGWKRFHGFKFQGIMTPDGIFSSLGGPVMAARSDWYLVKKSGFIEIMEAFNQRNQLPQDQYLFVYGDPAYQGTDCTIGAYKRRLNQPSLTPQQQLFNRTMSSHRISVEHGFGMLGNQWSKMEMHRTLRMLSSPVAAYFGTTVLLLNLQTCLRGNQVSRRFGIAPPSLEEYFESSERDHGVR